MGDTRPYTKHWDNLTQGIVRSRATGNNGRSWGRVSNPFAEGQKRTQLRSERVVYNVNKSDSVKWSKYHAMLDGNPLHVRVVYQPLLPKRCEEGGQERSGVTLSIFGVGMWQPRQCHLSAGTGSVLDKDPVAEDRPGSERVYSSDV